MENKLLSGLTSAFSAFAALPYSAGAMMRRFFHKTKLRKTYLWWGHKNLKINQDIQGDLVLAGSRLGD